MTKPLVAYYRVSTREQGRSGLGIDASAPPSPGSPGPRASRSSPGSSDRKVVGGFTPAVSPTALKAVRAAIRDLNIRRSTQVSLADIARKLNPLLRGWIAYYGRYTPSALSALFRYVNLTLLAWVRRKFKRYKGHKVRAARFVEKLARTRPDVFVHWRLGMTGAFA